MSIYGSTFTAGDPDDPDSTGVVLVRDGGTNHWPSPERNRRGEIGGAEIPSWCVPGHDDYDQAPGYAEPGGWYRLSSTTWQPDPDDPDDGSWVDHKQYLLDEDAVRALRDDLTRWLDLPKTQPEQETRADA